MRSGRSLSAVNSWMICGLLVLDDLEVVFGQIGDEAAFLVGDGEQHVDAGDVEDDARVGRLGTGGLLRRLLSRKRHTERTPSQWGRSDFI